MAGRAQLEYKVDPVASVLVKSTNIRILSGGSNLYTKKSAGGNYGSAFLKTLAPEVLIEKSDRITY